MTTERTPIRVPGHSLWHEGAPHNERGVRLRWNGTGGAGRALCTCGELSPDLPTGAARKRWHREHKTTIASGSTEASR